MTRRRKPPDVGGVRRASIGLAVRLGALMLLLFMISGAVILVIVGVTQAAARDQLLAETADRIDSSHDAPAGVWVAIEHDGMLDVSPDMPAGLPDREAMAHPGPPDHGVQRTVVVRGVSYVIRTQIAHSGIVQAVFDGRADRESFLRLLTALAVTSALAVVFAAVIAAWFARRVMRPMAQALETQKRFVADAGHELRTPLTILSTRAQLVRRGIAHQSATSPELVRDADELVDDARVLAEILEDLLEAADPRSSEPDTVVDLCALADEVVASFRQRAAERGLELRRDGAQEAVTVRGHPVALRRAMSALIDNAEEFATSRVTLTIASTGREATVSVRDDGPGFGLGAGGAESGRVFERFVRSRSSDDAAERRHYGLGLALVAEIAARHAGTVTASDVPGGSGAVVTIRLPAADARR
ncbi:MAG TPA: HAMP domain-containing sensor histidine kinase [Humibacter sp.]|nr:HAMP domain-containing sensor histidine kinase [Humibacter sp.]